MSQVKNLRFSGTVGPVIFYYLGDKLYMRSMPGKVRQTENTRARSTNFGTASAAARILRNGLAGMLPDPKNKIMQNRFSGVISRWLATQPVQDIPQSEDMFNGFTFGEKSFADFFRVPFTVSKEDNAFRVQTESFNPMQMIHAPAGTAYATCTFSLAACTLISRLPVYADNFSIDIPWTGAVQPGIHIDLACDMRPGILIVIAASLVFATGDKNRIVKKREPRYLPASIIKSFYTGK